MGSILAAMNRPKANKKKKGAATSNNGKKRKRLGGGAVLDRSVARMLADTADEGRAGADRALASQAARAALAAAGRMQVSEQVNFAGKSITVVRSMDKSSSEAQAALASAEKEKQQSTLDKIVGELKNPKKAMSAVEKSSYDWDKFKEDKGIAEQLEKAAKENSYVDKQQFLQRVDERTFDVELAERDKARAMAAAAAAKAEKK